MAEKIPSVKLDFENNEMALLDADGTPIEDSPTFKDKAKSALKMAVKYSPIGMSYMVSKGIMDKGMEIVDRALNDNELNRVENISFEQILQLIEDGKDKFDEVDMAFSASQINGFTLAKIKELNEKDFNIDFGKKGDIGLQIKVKYKA